MTEAASLPCPVCLEGTPPRWEELVLYVDPPDRSVGIFGTAITCVEGDCSHVDRINNLILDDALDASWVGHRLWEIIAEVEAAYAAPPDDDE